ncbi:hypothetical protein Pmar_PMAR026311 [Perkinsus marinus ATCC 50983]|uniref:Uncharacterized protein n=1 Tax=Perkinsus marinus (strain ATCC 50983 / TXsc) TaxID=423536 RepID=C5K5J9_PERM5|nr:hypothetical protein Pmar_PMAR026311 [Perkinsus marinus ATCC 50983]EER20243.1 hypothetical protein Pmar_PMAR026311 [Perkinsus marinus ATCC 50983]|eukprot:XP_002788447.1 hypothetical protein Pmar_PMAR026311 [Perkinsus marinus ATCC 50983]
MDRFPIDEASWMSLLDMPHEYPDGVVQAKFSQILTKLKVDDPDLKAVDFARDYQLVRNEYFRLKAAGAVIPDIHNIKPAGLSASWAFYDNSEFLVPFLGIDLAFGADFISIYQH